MDLRAELRSRLGLMVESKASDWWDEMKDADRVDVCQELGFKKSKSRDDFSDLEDSEKDELEAYYKKHGRKVGR